MSADSSAPKLLITGATGTMGSLLLRELDRRGVPAAAAVRPGRAGSLGEYQASARNFDLLDPETWESALEGIERLFLMRPPQISNVRRDVRPFLSFLGGRKLKQTLFLSVQGAERVGFIPHAKIEMLMREFEIPYTFFRPSFFMQNLTGTHLAEIREEGRLYLPAGRGKTNFVDVADLAEAAAIALTEEGYTNRAFTLTGEENLTYFEVAEKLSRGLGRKVIYRPASLPGFILYQLKKGRSLPFALVMTALYGAARFGDATGDSPELAQILGRPPLSLDLFIKRNIELLNGE